MVFEFETKSLTIINYNLNVVIVFVGNTGIFGVFNIVSGTAIIINSTTSIAWYLSGIQDLSVNLSGTEIDIYAAIKIYVNIIVQNPCVDYVEFNIDLLIEIIIQGSTDLSSLFDGNSDLSVAITESFTWLFTLIYQSASDGLFVQEFGVLNVVGIVVRNETAVLSWVIQKLICKFIRGSIGFANGGFIYNIAYNVVFFIEAIRTQVITVINLEEDLSLSYWSNDSLVFSVAASGLVSVNSVIYGNINVVKPDLETVLGPLKMDDVIVTWAG